MAIEAGSAQALSDDRLRPPIDLIEGDGGAILITTPDGIRQLINGAVKAYPLPGTVGRFRPIRFFRDRNGSLWIGTVRGLLHVHQGRTDVFTQSDSLAGDLVRDFSEDYEGNIWVATYDGGLDRFRDFVVPTISMNQGLSNNNVWSVLGARDGSVWLGTADGLNRWKGGQITVYRKHRSQATSSRPELSAREIIDNGLPNDSVDSLFQDDHGRIWVATGSGFAYFDNGRFVPASAPPAGSVLSIAGDSVENFWISDRSRGLLHLFRGSVVEQIPWAEFASKDGAFSLLTDPLQGGVWLGFVDGGVAYFKDGHTRASYKVADGVGEGRVMGLQLDRDGALWAATQGGLSRIKGGRVATLTGKNGLPCDTVHWMMEDDAHSVWLYMPCGLVRMDRAELDAWATDPKRTIRVTVFDSSDGVRSHPNTSGWSPRVAKTADGKIWFLPFDGVSVIDPHHLAFNKLPPPVHVEKIVADDKTYDEPANGVRLPTGVRYLTIDYTALSLVVPEKVHFRYKVEGQDKDWREVVNDREVQYSNLPPKHYKLSRDCLQQQRRVERGRRGAGFRDPSSVVSDELVPGGVRGGFLAMIWGIYELRVRQLAHEFDMRLEERVNERTRIARDLHDTLLQGFQGLIFRFQTAFNQFKTNPDKAYETMESALNSADQAIAESRGAIHQLRSSSEENNLEQVMLETGRELASSQKAGVSVPSLRVIVEGERRAKRPIIRDEVYRIARELLRNAYRHAHAQNIEAELRYDDDAFLMVVRDDGRGIDPEGTQRSRARWTLGLAGHI